VDCLVSGTSTTSQTHTPAAITSNTQNQYNNRSLSGGACAIIQQVAGPNVESNTSTARRSHTIYYAQVMHMLKSLGIVFLLSISALATADEPVRSITVNGTGTAEIEPDRATIRMSIVARDKEVAVAQEAAAEVSNRVLRMARRQGVDRDDIDTTGASVRPEYRWNQDENRQELLGYIAERQMIVRIDDLETLGTIIEGAVSAGVNQVSPPVLDSSRRKDAYREALRAAAEDAEANAEVLAKSLDADLGDVISINAGANTPQPPMPHRAAVYNMAASADQAESYNAADLSFTAHVTVVFELDD